MDPGWSPDGTLIVFGGSTADQAAHPIAERWQDRVLRIVDLRTRRISTLPGSEGLWYPRRSPDGRYIAAMRYGSKTDVALQRCDPRADRTQ